MNGAIGENYFDAVRQYDAETDDEFWLARDLQNVFDYSSWQKFESVIEKAKKACEQSGFSVQDHFNPLVKMVPIGSGAGRSVEDIKLSRYACYLIVQNGDPSKTIIANGQTYFAVQTRRQELTDEGKFKQLSEDRKRVMLRNELSDHNKHLASAAKYSGVQTGIDYAVFQNHGYKGLYGGLDNKAIHAKKNLKTGEKILDHMGSTELAANLFRATQTEDKLRRENIRGKTQANKAHYEVGQKVRQAIEDIGGEMPENLPKPEKSIKQIEKEHKNIENIKQIKNK